MYSLGTKHWQMVNHIFCYLSGTRHLGLFYPKGGTLAPGMRAFLDIDWAGCFGAHMSTSGFYFLLSGGFYFLLSDACILGLSKK